MLKLTRVLSLWLSFCGAVSASSQTFTLKKIIFQNPGSFSQAQLESVSGLRTGVPLKADDLTTAAQKLLDTGYFEDVTPSVEGALNAATAKFDLKLLAPSQLLAIGFENLFWLSPDELHKALQSASPLFNDTLAEGSQRGETMDAALKAALAAKGVQARVEHETVQPTLEYPRRVVEFRVITPAVLVGNVHLAGVAPALVPLVQKSVNTTARTPLNLGLAGNRTADRILAPLLDAGYLHASLANLTVTPPAESTSPTLVVVSAALDPGEVYHVGQISFAGSPLFSAEAFSKAQTLHAGDVASRSSLLKTLTPLDNAYRSQGFMDVVINTDPKMDETAHTVSYTISVVPGGQYHIHEVTIQGLSPAQQAEVDQAFRLKTGELYDPVYLSNFLRNNTALRSLSELSGSFRAVAYPATHTVDLSIVFVHIPGR